MPSVVCLPHLRGGWLGPKSQYLARIGLLSTAKRAQVGLRSDCSASSFHVVLALLFIEFAFLFGSRILVLLVFGDQVIHVTLGFRKLHFVHSLSGVPVKESLAAEHCRKVFSNTLEHLLDRCGVA